MRADILQIKSERDQALGDLAGNKRRSKSIKEDLSLTKFKLSKAQQEKMQLERDQRATLSLAKSLQGNVHSSVDYYKRKVRAELLHMSTLLTRHHFPVRYCIPYQLHSIIL